jgi:16S rRNA (guanine527-N7)-methyltransferase
MDQSTPNATLMLPSHLPVWQETLAWEPNSTQQQQFQQLYEQILDGNSRLNLTRITEPADFWEKHLWDSLRGIFPRYKDTETPQSFQVIDIGTGAGFPGVPVAIAKPTWQVTLLDSTQKKMAFVQSLVEQMQLANAKTVVGRAENLGKQPKYRQRYQLALVRAVGQAPLIAQYALPLLQKQGVAVLYRGHWSEADTAELQPIVQQLGGMIEAVEGFSTPLTHSVRHCLYLRKVA